MKKFVTLFLAALLATFGLGCNSGSGNGGVKTPADEKHLAPSKTLAEVDAYNIDAYLQPYWYTREIYNETAMFVGEEGECTLIYTPDEIKSVRSYTLATTYTEGVDYAVDGNKIKRLKGSSIPYMTFDEYFTTEPGMYAIGADSRKTDIPLTGNRFLAYGEEDTFTRKQIAVTYKHSCEYKGFIPEDRSSKFTKFIQKAKSGEKTTVMFYGDSITVGCNASGTSWGGFTAPFTPDWPHLVCDYIEQKYGADIEYLNRAEGGWRAIDGVNNYNERIALKSADIDLFVIAYGMNDTSTSGSVFKEQITDMTERYLSVNPDGCVLLVSCMMPNCQSTWVGNQTIFEAVLDSVALNRDNVAVAPVNSMFKYLESTGKLTRDFLANNINHPNDFGVRAYAQVILKTLLGSDFVTEKWES